ncbi:hypothetical protein QE380_000136 [Acinetobacter baylyi]|uniref:Chemotaxis protein n=1 Tax=Acinetobacter baylyi TaxID=202950 RepID=A0ABU0URN9_ACIBI|nr:hypothetical protein [Acinetobacter baylyi]MDQ1207213.1 hypothetical protein [Acinetobacter baylyi]MDR6105705.1 hypothetical protein [Acinetobacter baylyi]MDR6187575.1 hypothetical protein [Acinetobacter baylyi]
MKLILKEYLRSLKERNELDALLPDLLTEMGMIVTSLPQRGTRQNGVDIMAVGKNTNQEDTVFLFSVKDGDLNRTHWNGDSDQALRPSIEEIIDVYIPNRIPHEHKNKKIIICLCFGGNILEQVRENVSSYTSQKTTDNISFEEWNGDKIAELIIQHLLKESLLPVGFREELRRSIAMIEEPEASIQYFHSLLKLIEKSELNFLRKIRLINLCLWILYSWSRNLDNLESIYQCSEKALFISWLIIKDIYENKNKEAREVKISFENIIKVYRQITENFVNKFKPFCDKIYAISANAHYGSNVNTNIKLFDILSRFSIYAYWLNADIEKEKDENIKQQLIDKLCNHLDILKLLILNNSILFTPIKDSQILEISLFLIAFNLSNEEEHIKFLKLYVINLINALKTSYGINYLYPVIYEDFDKLLNHSSQYDNSYFKEVTSGSLMLPTLALISAIFEDESSFKILQEIQKEKLSHCNFQLWFPREKSESIMLRSPDRLHGACWSSVPIQKAQSEFLKEVELMLSKNEHLKDFSLLRNNLDPIFLVACRHYRQPIPLNFLI